MKEVVGIKKSESWKMFNQIAHKYDAINTIISWNLPLLETKTVSSPKKII